MSEERTLQPKTIGGIELFCKDHQCEDLLLTPEGYAWLWFKMRVAEDNERWFPSGKWSTLQRMCDLLEAQAKEARHGQYVWNKSEEGLGEWGMYGNPEKAPD